MRLVAADQALRRIARGRLPCVECRVPHHPTPTPGYADQWSDPDDGHAYAPVSERRFAAVYDEFPQDDADVE